MSLNVLQFSGGDAMASLANVRLATRAGYLNNRHLL